MSVNKVITISGDVSCEIVIGRALLEEVCKSVSKNATKVLVVHPVGLSPSAELLREALISIGYEAILAGVPDSEDAKRVEVAAFCWGIMGQSDFTRSDTVIGFGGGSTTDLAGFVAATWLRGIQLIQVPTTLLGMVDASIGGKTGINTAEGKNLVGSFYSPTRVIVDLDTLASLPRNEILAGFAEVVKYGFISDPRILELIEQNVDFATDPKTDVFREIVERCIAIKAKVVGGDFKEAPRPPVSRTHKGARILHIEEDMVPGAFYVDVVWIFEGTGAAPAPEHTHEWPELIAWAGADPAHPGGRPTPTLPPPVLDVAAAAATFPVHLSPLIAQVCPAAIAETGQV
jgi:hypothetical protein